MSSGMVGLMGEPKFFWSKPTGEGGRCGRPVAFRGAPCGVDHPVYVTNRSVTPGGPTIAPAAVPSALASIDELVESDPSVFERPVEVRDRVGKRFYFDLATAETYAGRAGQRLCHTAEGRWAVVPYCAPGEAIRAVGPPMPTARAIAWLRSNGHEEAASSLEAAFLAAASGVLA